MLAELSIKDIVLVETLTVRFGGGLSVLTGETGAGKSILLDALALALGGRGDAGLVRKGCEQGQVTAVFDIPANFFAHDWADSDTISVEAGEPLILRRVQTADGRTRGYVNDQTASAALMRQIGARLVEIHGQHADRALVDAETHRALLDAFGGLAADVAAVGEAWQQWGQARKQADAQRERIGAARRELDFLQAATKELSALAAQPGEEEELAARRTRMMQSEKIVTDLNDALDVFNGPHSPVPQAGGLLRSLERKLESMPDVLGPIVEHLGAALDHLSEAQTGLEVAVNNIEFDQRALEQTEERLFALRGAARKFNVAVDDLAALTVELSDQLNEVDEGEARLAVLEKAEAEALARYDRLAAELSSKRSAVADDLATAVNAELPSLKLERARFSVPVETLVSKRSAQGCDHVEFHVQTNPGTNPGPMMRVASGGELSRFLLALKVVLADRASAPTLVFDEIDTGVGGAVADAIGARLARLSKSVQVLSVTHAPQVAARADAHYLIAKGSVEDAASVKTRVAQMDASARREEIARMLSGASVTDEARAAADQLLRAG